MRINPIKALRERHNITQRFLAFNAEMTPISVLRYEQGLYEKPSQRLVDALALMTATQVEAIEDAYKKWRHLKREDSASFFTTLPALTVHPNEHPFVTFRKTITKRAVGEESRVGFCILLAIHPAVVAEYEAARVKHMPRLIRNALLEAGVRESYINDLDQFGCIYYERRSGTNPSK